MQLSLQTFTTLMQNMAASVQSAAKQLLDLTVGSTLRAVLEANASIALWMQWLILLVLQTTRAATSTGSDLDSWMADFALIRLPAAPATGIVTVTRFTVLGTALVPVGALVRTSDGTQTFAVDTDTTNAAWNAAQNGYVMSTTAAAMNVPVVAQVAGAAGNVQAGAITLLASAIPGIDAVGNTAAFANGLDAETDAAFRARFRNYIDSRSRATALAVGYAVTSIQQGLLYTIQENQDAGGNHLMGSFVVTVDDGSGYPSTTLLSTVQSVVDAVRPVGSIFAIQPPTVTVVNVKLTLTVAGNTTTSAQLAAPVATALTGFINSLPIGALLPISRISQLAYAVSPAIANVTLVQLNGAVADIAPPANGVVKVGLVTVN
jgi:uncharacterized phage protein gp47/JayE